MIGDRIQGNYDDLCTMFRNMLAADGVLIVVFGGTKGSGPGVDVSEQIYRALPEHLRGLADQIEVQLARPHLTAPNVRRLGDGLHGIITDDGRYKIFDERLGTVMPLLAKNARNVHDWLHDTLPPLPLPPLTQAIIKQARACQCGTCEACKAVIAAGNALEEPSDG